MTNNVGTPSLEKRPSSMQDNKQASKTVQENANWKKKDMHKDTG